MVREDILKFQITICVVLKISIVKSNSTLLVWDYMIFIIHEHTEDMNMTLKRLGAVMVSMALLVGGLSGCANNTDAQNKEAENTEVEVASEVDSESTAEVNAEESAEAEASPQQTAFNTYFITPELLNVSGEENLVILDARGQEAYDKGHIPGALPLTWQSLSQMDVEFASENWGTLKSAETLSEALAGLGLQKDSMVIVYSDTQKGWGEDGRIKWTLQAAGIQNVKMLDGGIEGWANAGFELTKTATVVEATEFQIEALDLVHSIDTATLSSEYDQYKVIDTRDLDEFEGAQKFGEARGGHLPGALWMSYKDLLEKDGTLKSPDTLETVFQDAGLSKSDKIVTYCTAGIRSAHYAEILKMLGYDNVVNYDASYYVWANTPELKVGRVVKDHAYNYYTADHLKAALEADDTFELLDIQVEEEFDAHHITGAVETNAFPVKSDEDKAKLDITLEALKANSTDIVIVCPRGGGGAQRTYQHLEAQGIASNRLYILEGGQAEWPYSEFMNQ